MNPPGQNPLARRIKEQGSLTRKLRGWVASDPTQNDPLVDALNELTALRLLQHEWTACGTDAQDALTRAAALVAFHGAVGPFTPLDDAVRFFTATVHIAWAQTGAGNTDAATTVTALTAWRGMVPHLSLADALAARTSAWFLLGASHAHLRADRVAAANATADAALDRSREIPEADGPEGRLSVRLDVLTHLAGARWAAGRPDEALAAGAEAIATATDLAAISQTSAARVTPTWAARVASGLTAVVAQQADRLRHTDRSEAATALIEETSDILPPFAARLNTSPQALVEGRSGAGISSGTTNLPAAAAAWSSLSPEDALAPTRPRGDAASAPPAPPASPGMAASAMMSSGPAAARDEYERRRDAGEGDAALAAAAAWVDAARAAPGERGELVASLTALAQARRAAGDWWGARQPAKEAKALARRLGRGGEYA
ncbi:MAG: hypothetical protein ACK5LS_09285 [Propioniciclava sp.]